MPTECSAEPIRVCTRSKAARWWRISTAARSPRTPAALLLGATDRAIGLVERFAACFRDGRAAERVEHEVATLVGQRVFGIALGYEDLVDHDQLRHDPVLAVVARQARGAARPTARRSPARARSTGSSTRRPGADRYHRIGHDGAAIEALFVDLFLDAHRTAADGRSCSTSTPPTTRCTATRRAASSTATTTATATCRSTSSAAATCWRPSCGASNIDASAGAVEEVARIVGQIRARWPRVRIVLRADSGFAREALMAWCEAEPGRLRLRPRPQPAPGRAKSPSSSPGPRTTAERDRPAGAPLRRLPLDDPRQLEPPAARRRQGRVDAGPRRRAPTRASSSPRSARRGRTPARSTSSSTAPAARWRTASRSASSTCSPTAPRAATMRANQLRLWFASMAYVLLCALRRIGLAGTPGSPAPPAARIRLGLLKIGALVRHRVRRITLAMAFELSRRRRLPPRPRPIMRLIRTRPAQPATPPTNPDFDRAEAQRAAVPDPPPFARSQSRPS